MDPRHPVHVGGDYYPKQSRQNGQQGRCILNLYINVDGTVSATQLLKSTGPLSLACSIQTMFGDAQKYALRSLDAERLALRASRVSVILCRPLAH
jgi:Gram-negative bacterial TonB protein C-terminal